MAETEDSPEYGDIHEAVSVFEEFNSAVVNGDLKAVAMLASQVDINQVNQQGVTAISIAVENGDLDLTRMLINCGADIDSESYCQQEGRFEIPLATAVRKQHGEIVKMLLERKCRTEGVSHEEGKSPLHWAATYGDIATADLLLQHGADINRVGPYMNTCLHFAVISGQEEMTRWLILRGAKFLLNWDDRNALHFASILGNSSIIALLLDYGCDFDTRDRFNFLAFSLTCLQGHLDAVRLFVDKMGGRVNVNDGLLHAAEAGYLTIIEYLVSRGADVNYRNSNGETALTVAAARGQYQVVLMMLNLGVKINVIDNRRYTPLLMSVMREHVDLATTLVIHCGDPVLPSTTAESPTRMAFLLRHPMLLKLFLLAGLDIIGEPWFTKQNLEAELRESDFTIPASRRNIWETRVLKEAWGWLKDRVHQPLKLKEACRIVIRCQLAKATNGRSILRRIDLLPFPNRILDYIKFNDLLVE